MREAVLRVLTRAGFDVELPQGGGLRLHTDDSDGVLVVWVSDDLLTPAAAALAAATAPEPDRELEGLRRTLRIALAAILRGAGFHVTDHPAGLRVNR